MTLEALDGKLDREADLADALRTFRRFLDPGFVRAFVHGGLAELRSGDGGAGRRAPAGHLRIHDAPQLDVRARVVSGRKARAGAPIVTLTRHTLVGNAGSAAFLVRRWRQPPLPNDVFDPNRRLDACDDVVLEPGEAIALSAPSDAFVLLKNAEPAMALTAAGSHVVPFAWHYDAVSGRPIRLAPVHKEWLYLQELLRLAAAVGDESSAPGLAALYAHPSHFVRWSAASTARRIAPQTGWDLCRALASDPHPQIRAAARAVLARAPGP
jgi:hypothetical protein